MAAARSSFAFSPVLPPGLFRLVLALAVVVSHISRFDIGRLAVLLFFFLSGYWTAQIWASKFGGKDVPRFYLSRYLRIAPLFLLITVAAALARHMPLQLQNFTLLGVGSTHSDPTGVSWSLDVELQFYFLLPLVMLALARAPAWLVVAVSLLLAALGFYVDEAFGVLTAAKYLPVFVLGSVISAKGWKPGRKVAAGSLAGFLALTVITAFTPFLTKTHPQPFDHDIWGFVWMLPLVPWVAHSLTIRSSKLDRHFGNLSFPLYLIHFWLIAVAAEHFGGGTAVKLAGAVAACVLALAVYLLVDRPVDHWRVRLTEPGLKPGA